MALKKRKKVVFGKDQTFFVGDTPLRPLNVYDSFQYLDLGVHFCPDGRILQTHSVSGDLEALRKAPLKPQQKEFLLVNIYLSRYYHQLVLGKVFAGHLKKIEMKVDRFVRDLSHLPHDIPSSAFHARVKDGGMGITCLRWKIQ